MAGCGPGGDLVAQARYSHRAAHHRNHRRSPLRGLRREMGCPFEAADVPVSAKPGFWLDPAGLCDLCRRASARGRARMAGSLRGADPARRDCRRGHCGRATQILSPKPRQQGRVCDVGLWRWSRHPNYFFEWFCWLAYPVIALSPLYPWSFAPALAPAFMYWILVHVTGIPPLEEQMLRSRGELYRAYQSRTSAFFPMPPHREIAPKGIAQ